MVSGRPLLRLGSPLHAKLRRGLAGRQATVAEFERWGSAQRDLARPLIWLHAPSVGEALMAQAITGALRQGRPELQVAFTHFSPSAERIAARVGADVHGYLPWDTRTAVRRALRALKPGVIAFVRTEVWPVLAREARQVGARLALVNAVLPRGSSRLRATARLLLRPAYQRLDAVGAVTEEHARHFTLLGIPGARTRVTGDARFDQVWAMYRQRAAFADAALLVERLRDPAVVTVVAGSTWPADEARLLPAFALISAVVPSRLLIAPHEPEEPCLARLERTLDGLALGHARLAKVESRPGRLPAVVLVDRIGVLAHLYAAGDIAYVGGGFHLAGLHSVVEPAALALPVLFGPRHANAREAAELAVGGGGAVVTDTEVLAGLLLHLARDAGARARAGRAAADYVRSELGGAARNAQLILDVLEGAAPA